MNSIYSWTNKQYTEMSSKEYTQFQEACRCLWYFYNVTNDYNLYAKSLKGETIALNTDISKSKYYDFKWLHKRLENLSQGEVIELVNLFQSVIFCIAVANHEDFILMNLEKRGM